MQVLGHQQVPNSGGDNMMEETLSCIGYKYKQAFFFVFILVT